MTISASQIIRLATVPTFIVLLCSCMADEIPKDISSYQIQNNANVPIHFGSVDKGGCVNLAKNIDPGQTIEVSGLIQFIINEPRPTKVPPDQAKFISGVFGYTTDGDDIQPVIYLKQPLDRYFSFRSTTLSGLDTIHAYVAPIGDEDLDFSVKIPKNQYWVDNQSSEDIVITIRSAEEEYDVWRKRVSAGEKYLLASVNDNPRQPRCIQVDRLVPREIYHEFTIYKIVDDVLVLVDYKSFDIDGRFSTETNQTPEGIQFDQILYVDDALVNGKG